MTRNRVFTLLLIKLAYFYLVMGGSGLGPPNKSVGQILSKPHPKAESMAKELISNNTEQTAWRKDCWLRHGKKWWVWICTNFQIRLLMWIFIFFCSLRPFLIICWPYFHSEHSQLALTLATEQLNWIEWSEQFRQENLVTLYLYYCSIENSRQVLPISVII